MWSPRPNIIPGFKTVHSQLDARTISSAAHFDSWYGEPQSGRARRKLTIATRRTPASSAARTTFMVPWTWTAS